MLEYKLSPFAQQALEAQHNHPVATAQVRATIYQDDKMMVIGMRTVLALDQTLTPSNSTEDKPAPILWLRRKVLTTLLSLGTVMD